MPTIVTEVDAEGRIVLPASRRRKYLRGGKVILRARGDTLEIVPQENVDLTAYFDAAESKVKANLSDWHGVRRELRKR